MIKRFLDGLAFGAGFSIAFAAVWIIASALLIPAFNSSGPISVGERVITESLDEPRASAEPSTTADTIREFEAWMDMPADEQIASASVIAMANYEMEDDGRKKAVISEILKREEGVVFHFEIGDEYHSASYYPGPSYDRGDGIVLLFTGSPARLQYSTTIRDGRVYTLNNMPIELLRQKAAEAE